MSLLSAHLAPLQAVGVVAQLQRVQREGAQAVWVGGQQGAATGGEGHGPRLAPPLGAVRVDAAAGASMGSG